MDTTTTTTTTDGAATDALGPQQQPERPKRKRPLPLQQQQQHTNNNSDNVSSTFLFTNNNNNDNGPQFPCRNCRTERHLEHCEWRFARSSNKKRPFRSTLVVGDVDADAAAAAVGAAAAADADAHAVGAFRRRPIRVTPVAPSTTRNSSGWLRRVRRRLRLAFLPMLILVVSVSCSNASAAASGWASRPCLLFFAAAPPPTPKLSVGRRRRHRLHPPTKELAGTTTATRTRTAPLNLLSVTTILEEHARSSSSTTGSSIVSVDPFSYRSNTYNSTEPRDADSFFDSLPPQLQTSARRDDDDDASAWETPNHASPRQGRTRRNALSSLWQFWVRRRADGSLDDNNANNSAPPPPPVTIRSLWRHRHARSAEEGIRRELTGDDGSSATGSSSTLFPSPLPFPRSTSSSDRRTARRLSSVLAKANDSIERTSRRMAARTLTGLITALADEVVDLDVEVDARDDTRFHNKHITAVRIKFSRLGFKPLQIGGHERTEEYSTGSTAFAAALQKTNKLLDSFRIPDRALMGLSSWNDEDYNDSSSKDEQGINMEKRPELSADEAFDRIDVDHSGSLDREELVQALNLAALLSTGDKALRLDEMEEGNMPILEKLASDLFELYDVNGDGVVDRREYKTMVDDMAALRKAQEQRVRKQKLTDMDDDRNRDVQSTQESWMDSAFGFVQNNTVFIGASVEFIQNKTRFLSTGLEFVQNKTGFVSSGMEYLQSHSPWLPWRTNEKAAFPTCSNASSVNVSLAPAEHCVDSEAEIAVLHSPEIVESISKSVGSITFSDVKMDLRRLFFGAIPILKHIVPGGPLILEPFTTTLTGSFDRQDIMNSVLLDAGLRRLVMRALRKRVGSLRDFLEGAMFKGRSWKTSGSEGPRVDIPELTNVEFDENDKLIITGRARVKTTPDSSVIEQSFKVRTSLGTGKNGRFIRLDKPELALVIECPESLEKR